MEAASRKRCNRRVVAAIFAVVLISSLQMHHEAYTLMLIDTPRKYMKDNILVNLLKPPTLMKNETRLPKSDSIFGPSVSNATTITTTSTNRTMPTSFPLENSTTSRLNGTIVVYLSGEMGNHLLILAKSLIVKRMAKEMYGISAELVLRHQHHPKWVHGRNSIRGCFPRLRHIITFRLPTRILPMTNVFSNKTRRWGNVIRHD